MIYSSGSTLAAIGKELGIYDIARQLLQSPAGVASLGLISHYVIAVAIQLGLLGMFVAQVKMRARQLCNYVYRSVFVTVRVNGGAMIWIEAYTARDPYVQSQLMHYRLTADDVTSSTYVDRPRKLQPTSAAIAATWIQEGVSYKTLPLPNGQVIVKHAGRKIWLAKNEGATSYFRMTVYSWHRQAINDFLQSVHKQYHEKGHSEVHIYHNSYESPRPWSGPIVQTARPWSSVIPPEAGKNQLLEEMKLFVSEKKRKFYLSRGIPYRKGYLFYGPPGTGKTTLIKALASKLRMDLYNVTPGEPGMDDRRLIKCLRACPRGSILLIEDIDCVMPMNRAPEDLLTGGPGRRRGETTKETRGSSQVTLSGLLNAIDGITSQEGSIFIATTNYRDRLDEALLRSGRFDRKVPFDFATRQQAADVFKHFFYLAPDISLMTDESTIEKDEEAIITYYDSEADVQEAADKFAAIIKDKGATVSVATIQAYLLPYMEDPLAALEHVPAWLDACIADKTTEAP